MIQNKINDVLKTSETDVMKVCAVLTVIFQSILSLMIKMPLNPCQKTEIGILYDLVRFSASVFIFAICFDLAKLKNVKYSKYIYDKFKEILIPYFFWSTIYILTINFSSYKSISDIVQAYIFGTASAHLWYTVMMFQFHLLIIPILFLAKKVEKNKNISITVLCISTALYLFFLFIYDKYVFSQPNKYIGYMDRTFIMYSIFCVLAVIASVNYNVWKKFIHKIRFFIIPLFFTVHIITDNELLSSHNIDLKNATSLKPSMFAYNIVAILLIFAFALILIKHKSNILFPIKWLSTYAFRAYLSNVFCLNIIIKVLGRSLKIIPLNAALPLIWIATVSFSFAIVYLIHHIALYIYIHICKVLHPWGK